MSLSEGVIVLLVSILFLCSHFVSIVFQFFFF